MLLTLKRQARYDVISLPVLLSLLMACLITPMLYSCAKMGAPDGGWYDETPPHVVGAMPAEKSTHVSKRNIRINFNEFVKIDNPTQNVVVSPPQLEVPEIKGEGKSINVKLIDKLQPNTTYTIDFSNAISDNNEGNPLGNFTYSFSTGNHIDTLEVAGYVVQAADLEPVKGILVGLYADLSDTAFKTKPMLRVSRTDSRGHFIIRGVAPGKYRVYALQDADGNYSFNQRSEMLAFNHDIIEPSFRPDVRQDTLWRDSLHIESIAQVSYTHFLPDNICLRAFNEIVTDRHLLKSERPEPNHFTLYYTYGDSVLPNVRGLNFNTKDAFVVESSAHKDTVTYWLRDTALVNQDTLKMVVTQNITDSTGVLRQQEDTLTLLAKVPYAKRLKDKQKAFDEWKKKQDKLKKRGEPYETTMPEEPLKLEITPSGDMDPDQNISIVAKEPLKDVDTNHVRLFSHPSGDSLWYKEPYELKRISNEEFQVKAAWKPGTEYSFEADSTAFETIYGTMSGKLKQGLKVRGEDAYASLIMTISGMQGRHIIAQLLDGQGKTVKVSYTDNGQAEFYYLKPGKYFMRIIVDANNNKKWDTGNYDTSLQPEEVYYNPDEIECKAKWDLTLTWNPLARPIYQQKPEALKKQKADKEKSIQHRNVKRAQELGIQYLPK
ncbi:MAG: Ig-like domain-containing protein [Prevotellaceae bacterium]|nr:Ig-like domain-containing protein [Prevotellaceae bacterium]